MVAAPIVASPIAANPAAVASVSAMCGVRMAAVRNGEVDKVVPDDGGVGDGGNAIVLVAKVSSMELMNTSRLFMEMSPFRSKDMGKKAVSRRTRSFTKSGRMLAGPCSVFRLSRDTIASLPTSGPFTAPVKIC